ncbi:MAG: hypothetical protein J5564_07140 [Clostridia bacterium]|nr:hypothetical protein [Clostridia bacterium]
MFGYVMVNPDALSETEKQRFRSYYCGLCRTLKSEFGNAGRLTLSNDMTFLSLLLSALYEPQETQLQERCLLHPLRPHPAVSQETEIYAADMNILLAYHKCLDDLEDGSRLRGRTGKAALKKAYDKASRRRPLQRDAIADSLDGIRSLEREKDPDLDSLARRAGQMLGACYVWKQDAFAPYLRRMGEALGRFVYLMDAWEDYDDDLRCGRFNPLSVMRSDPDYEQRVEEILTMEMAQCTQAFDCLPVIQDSQLIRNVLYSGVWGKYALIRERRKEKKA